MILRALHKTAEPDPPRQRLARLRRLAPFEALHDPLLRQVAERARTIELPPGSWPEAVDPAQALFLDAGVLAWERDDGRHGRLCAEDPGAAFPLPTEPGWRWRPLVPSRLLSVPDRFLELYRSTHAGGDDDGTGIELHEDDDEAHLYLHFRELLARGDFELPAMPELAVRIGKALDDPDTLNEDIARLIQLDPALSARVMRVVNSAALGARTPIATLREAVCRLGRHQVRNLVFSCIIKELFRTDSALLRDRMRRLWDHSRKVAAISSVLARLTPGMDPERALLAGLIHDIGVIPLLHAARDLPELRDRPAVLDRLVAEMKGEVGQLTLTHWRFDPGMAYIARHAEDWHRLGHAVADDLDIVLIAQLHAQVGEGTGTALPRIDAIPAFRRLALGALTPRRSLAVLDRAEREIAEIEQLLR